MPDRMRALRHAAFHREGGRCLFTGAPLPGGEDGDGWDLHHRRPGGMGGDERPDRHTLPNVVAIADHVHRHIHENPEWAKPLGLLLPKSGEGSDPAEVPVRTWRGWQFLLPEGGYQPLLLGDDGAGAASPTAPAPGP
jgi:hypothetical protein